MPLGIVRNSAAILSECHHQSATSTIRVPELVPTEKIKIFLEYNLRVTTSKHAISLLSIHDVQLSG